MAHYKKDAASNRDALFGSAGGGGGGGSSRGSRGGTGGSASTTSRPSSRQQPPSRPSAPAASSSSSFNATPSTITPGPSSLFGGKVAARTSGRGGGITSILSGQAKIDKMAEAEDYRLKAKKAMTRGVFSRADPIAAGNYYKRAADAYKVCGENRLERLHRIASGDVQMGQDAYATAATEYTRAAELAETSDETLARKKQEVHKMHLDAASAWIQMGEKGRGAESTMKAAFGLLMGDDFAKVSIDKKALAAIEKAIESFTPDPLNRKRDHRRTGHSAYEDPNAPDPQAERRSALELARQNILTDAFAHETLFQTGAELIRRREYDTALYAYGAGTASLEAEGFATVSLGRAYLSETILTLAMGDAVAASKDFRDVHLQRTSYLSSRECALAEDLIRAVDARDPDALEEARSKSGQHRSALANLEPVVRELVLQVRVTGRAKKSTGAGGNGDKKPEAGRAQPPAAASRPSPTAAPVVKAQQPQRPVPSTSPTKLSVKELEASTDANFAEMEDIMGDMGLDSDDDSDDDSDIDLT